MFGYSRVKRHQVFLSRKIVSSFYRCSCLYQWPHGRSYSAGCNQPSQVDDTLRRRLEKRIYIPPSTRECIEYYNDIRNRNAPRAQTSAGLSLRRVMHSLRNVANRQESQPSLTNKKKSYILLTDTNSCIVAFHPIPPIYFYVSDPSIHPSIHRVNITMRVAWIMV